jgi:RNase P subunit RPR2
MPTVTALELTIRANNMLATSAIINRVKVYCNTCDEHLATVKNEWIRLTTKYARPSQPGPYPGVVISDLDRVVLKMGPAAGCTISEVTCKKCRTIVGAYFRETATLKTQHLVNEHFYKLSHVTMKSNLRPCSPKFTSEPVVVVISSDAAEEDSGAINLNNMHKRNEEVTNEDTTSLNREVRSRSEDEMEEDEMEEGGMEEDGMGKDIDGINAYESVYRSRGRVASLWHVKTDNR